MDAVKFIEERRRMYKVTGKHSPTLAGWIPAEDVELYDELKREVE